MTITAVIEKAPTAPLTLTVGVASEANGRVTALRIPGGFWDVLVRPVTSDGTDRGWTAFALPRSDRRTTGARMEIAVGTDQRMVTRAAIQWRDSAVDGSHSMDRFRYVGIGKRPAAIQ